MKGDKLTCLRCDWSWTQRLDTPPVSCPRCRSYAWARPKGRPAVAGYETLIKAIARACWCGNKQPCPEHPKTAG